MSLRAGDKELPCSMVTLSRRSALALLAHTSHIVCAKSYSFCFDVR